MNTNIFYGSPTDMVKLAKDLGMTTVYLEDLISPLNFGELNQATYKDKEAEIDAILKVGFDEVFFGFFFFKLGEIGRDGVWKRLIKNSDRE